HEYAPEVKTTAAISNVSYGMPARKYVNMACMAKALDAGLDSCIIDPASPSMMGILYAHAAVSGEDKGGRKYNRAFRKKIIR
ncbi:MAG: methyltetrahydrofolate cobalamin methyltransferase, partial [Clostridia bacterium]|nr:methyltetrahydrofolate cobalamin methyltransferase [Clostridia bacterium]